MPAFLVTVMVVALVVLALAGLLLLRRVMGKEARAVEAENRAARRTSTTKHPSPTEES
jgi:Na+-transporting methylmalonyl-CoA/oxaloacetate decarboxylase gamma subunit